MAAPNTKIIDSDKPSALTDTEGLVSISQAAKILGISIDTVRRWDKQGILSSTRPDGKNRYFSVKELDDIKFSQPLSISEVSEQLNVSPSTLRRLETKGLIKPERNAADERVYDRKSLESFIQSQYFVRQKEFQEEVLEPLNGDSKSEGSNGKTKNSTHHDPATHALLGEHHVNIAQLKKFKNVLLASLAIVAGSFVIAIVIITLLFLMFPENTSKALGFYKKDANGKQFSLQPSRSLMARQLKPFSNTALRVVEAVNPDLRKQIAPFTPIEDVNDVLTPDASGNITTKYTFSFPDTSYLKIPDQGLIQNLNSQFVQGRVPGCDKGNIAIVGLCTSSIATTTSGGGTTIVSSPASSSGGSGTITSVNPGFGLSGGGSSGDVTLAIQLQSGSALEANNSGLSLNRSCAGNQLLKWNGTAWSCNADLTGISTVQSTDGSTVVSSASSLLFGPASNSNDEFSVNDLGSGVARVRLGTNVLQTTNYASVLDPVYVNENQAPALGVISGTFSTGLNINLASSSTTSTTSSVSGLEIASNNLRLLGGCASNQILKWNGVAWACATDATGGVGGSSSLDIQEGGVTKVSGATVLNYNNNDFNVTGSGSTAVIDIDYNNSHLTRDNQNHNIVGNWTFNDTGFTLQDDADNTKKLKFEVSGVASGTTRTLTVPNINGTIITTGNLTDINAVGTITSGVWQGSTIAVANGGTGLNTLAANGIIYGNGTSAVGVTAAGTSGQLLLGNSGLAPSFVTLSGDATLASSGAITLKNTGTAGTFGSASQVPVFTTDAQGRVIGVTNTAISLDANAINTGTLAVNRGGTGNSSYSDGQLLIGNTSTGGLTKTNLTAGAGVSITNGNGSITIASTTAGTCSTCANQSLSNLTGVSINTALLPGASNIDLGSGSAPFRDLYLGGTSTNNFHLIGSATAPRLINIPDASGTFAVSGSGNIALSTVGDITITGQIPVNNGGTGRLSLPANGVLFGNGSLAIGSTAAGTPGQVLLANASGIPLFTSLNGDISNISSSGSVTLVNTPVISGIYGSANQVPQISIDSKGRITNAINTNIAINSSAITSGNFVSTLTAGNGITVTGGSGNASNPTVAVNLNAVGSGLESTSNGLSLLRTCSNSQILQWNGSTWACVSPSAVSGTTLQQAYEASTANEITLNSTNGGLTVRDNSVPVSGNLFEVQSNTGTTTYFKVDVNGTSVGNGLAYSGSGSVSLTSAAASSLTVDSGTTGTLNIGTGANAKAITVGNTTGSTNVLVQSGSGGINFNANGASTGNIVIGSGSASATPDLFILDTKNNNTGDPTGVNGAMYYNGSASKFRCFQASAWTDCIGTGVGGGGSTAWSALTAPGGNLNLNMSEYTTNFTWQTASTAASFDGLTLGLNNNATTDTSSQKLLVIKNLDNGIGETISTTRTEELLRLENADDSRVTTGLKILNSSTGAIGTALDVSGAGFTNALSVGDNRILGGDARIQFNNFIVDSSGNVSIAGGSAYSSFGATTLSSTGGNTLSLISGTGGNQNLIVNPVASSATSILLGASGGVSFQNSSGNLLLNANGSNQVQIGGVSTGDVLLAGGSSGTGCTVINATGNLVCSGNVTNSSNSGTLGFWSRSGTTLTPATSGDNVQVTGVGSITYASGSTGNFDQSTSTGTFQTGSGAVSLNGDSTVAANKNLSLASGSGIFTQNYTGNATATTINANSATTGTAIAINATNLQSGKGLLITGGSALTTGNLLNLTGASYNHTVLNDSGSAATISVSDISSNANNGGVTSGLAVNTTINTSGSGTKTVKGVFVSAPTFTGCSGGSCIWDGYDVSTQSSSSALLTQNGLNIASNGIGAGTLNGINISNISPGAGTETAIQVGSGWDTAINGVGALNITAAAASVWQTTAGGLTVKSTGANLALQTVTSGDITEQTAANYILNGVGTSTYTVGAATTTGTISVGGTAQTGAITVGSSSGTNSVLIGNGTGATTVNISNSNTAGAVNIGASFTSGTVVVGGSSETGALTFGQSTVGQTINIGHATVATGNTQTILIGDSATGTGKDLITIGNTNAASNVIINSGTAGIDFNSTNATGSGTTSAFAFVDNALSTGTGLELQSSGAITGTGKLANFTANSLTTGTLLNLISTGLTTGTDLAITLGSALTTGNGLSITGASYNPGAGNSGSVANISFTDSATNTSGNSIVNGLSITSSINTSGATGTKDINGLLVTESATPTCTGGDCIWSGLKINTISAGALGSLTSNGINVAATGISSGSLNGINISNITAGVGNETGIKIGNGWDNDIVFNNANANLKLGATDNTGNFNIVDNCSSSCANLGTANNNLLNLRDLSTNFGAAVTSGAFIGRNSYFADEFNITKPSCTHLDTGINKRGDYGAIGASCATSNGEFGISGTVVGLNPSCSFSSPNTANGVETIRSVTTGTSNTSARCLEVTQVDAVTAYAQYLATNLPLMTIKASISAANTNQRFIIGMGDSLLTATASLPSNGIFFSNCDTSITVPTCGSNLKGVVTNTGANISSVDCGTIVANKFMYLRIEVRSTTDVHFFADLDVSDGITETECASSISTNVPSAAMAINMYTSSEINGLVTTFNIDYIRSWQDDSANTTGLDNPGMAIATSNVNTTTPINLSIMRSQPDGSLTFIDSSGIELMGIDTNGNAKLKGSLSSSGLNIGGNAEVAAASIDNQGNATFNNVKSNLLESDQVIAPHVGQRYLTNDNSIATGDVVALDSTDITKVKKNSVPYDNLLVGVVTSSPGLLVDNQSDGQSVVIALAGRVSVNVSTENGAINPGDPLTSSSTPGVAMKATKAGPVIGRAVMGYNADGVGRTLVLIDNGYSSGDITASLSNITERINSLEQQVAGLNPAVPTVAATGLSGYNGQPVNFADLQVGSMTVNLDLMVNGSMVVNGPATFKQAVRFVKDATFDSNLAVNGTATFNKDTAGLAKIARGEKSIRIIFSKPYSTPPVIILSLGDGKFANYSYRNVTTNEFEIILQTPASEDLTFSWQATTVNSMQTFVNQPSVP